MIFEPVYAVDALRAQENARVKTLAPFLSCPSHFAPAGLGLKPRTRTDKKARAELKAAGWTWRTDAFGGAWIPPARERAR